MTLCVSIPQAVSTIAIAKGSIEDFTKSMVVSIPQAVSTIAIRRCRSSKNSFVDVSIPQAVSTIAISLQRAHFNTKPVYCFNTASGKYYCNYSKKELREALGFCVSFNTASGKYYCNFLFGLLFIVSQILVSIPQAVSTIAMLHLWRV